MDTMPKATRAAARAVKTATPPASTFFDSADAWETWLSGNWATETELWLQISKKNAGVTSVTYDEALDVALCFGWIDGLKKSLNDDCYLQRFTPRRKGSLWSKRNVDKVAALTASKRMRPSGQAEVDAAKENGSWARAYAGSGTVCIPDDFRAALDANAAANDFFCGLNKTKQYPFLHRLETAKRPDTRATRIAQFVELLAAEKCL